MNDEFFDHIKHRLAETPVPDPDQAWKQMRDLLDTQGLAPHKSIIRSMSPWLKAAACVLVVSTSWAFLHHWMADSPKTAALRAQTHETTAQGAGNTVDSQGGSGSPGETVSGGTSASANENAATDGDAPTGAGAQMAGGAGVQTTGGGAASVSNPSASNATALGGNVPYGSSALGAAGQNPGSTTALRSTLIQTPFAGGVSSGRGADINTNANAGQALFANNAGVNGGQPDNEMVVSGDDSSTGASVSSKNLSLSLMDAGFLLDRPTGIPLKAGRQRAPVVASEVLHIHSPLHIPRLAFNLGIAANVPGSFRKAKSNGQSAFTPGVYPMAFLQYRVSPRWNLTLGVGAPSPVSYAHLPTATALYVAADTLQNKAQTTTSQKISRLVFADVPLTVGYQVVKHLSLQAGIQISYLLSQQNETVSVNTPLRGAFIPLALPSAATFYYPGNHDPLRAGVAKIDPRGLVGVNYQLRRFSATVQYQAGLKTEITQSDIDGNPANSRTSTVRMLIGYRLN